MPSVQKITSFFKPTDGGGEETKLKDESPKSVSVKRKLDEDEEGDISKVRVKIRKLSEELQVLVETLGESWFSALEDQFSQPYFRCLSEYVTSQRKIGDVFPSAEEVWAWTTRTKIMETRVVILGQDPYPTPGNAHGLCFSVNVGVPHPASLKNIFKELESDITGFKRPEHGFLGGWADQGVLLLNAVLTVRRNEANSHKGRGWEQFTDAVIRWISKNCEGVVFLLWGGYAQKKAAKVDSKKHHILKSTHPSPLGANKGGWFGCKHFSKCNALLEAAGRRAIDWSCLPEH